MKYITLTRGYSAIVDDDDYERLNAVNWYFHQGVSSRAAVRSVYEGHGKTRKVRRVLMHREILLAKPGELVDHKNGDQLDNRKKNLRICSFLQNIWNRKKRRDSTGSKFIGVSWSPYRSRWVCRITVNGKTRVLGLFKDEAEAARCYDQEVKKQRGEFAYLNFPKAA